MRLSTEKERLRLRQYLLGQLAETDQTHVEDAYFADDESFEDIEAAEAELTDAYVRGQLSEQDKLAFERGLNGSARLRERVAFARQFAAKIDGMEIPADTLPDIKRRTPFAWPTWRPVLVTALVMAGLIVVAGVGWWATRPGSAPAATDAKDVQRPAPPPTIGTPTTTPPPPGTGVAIAFVLAPGLTRSLDQAATLTIPPTATEIRIRLDYEGDAYPTYRAVIRTPEGRDVWSQSELIPARPGAKSVSIAFPAATLPAGDLVLTLSAIGPRNAMEDVADYAFRVVRR